MNRVRRYKNNAGSTLIEVLVVMVVLAVGIMTVVQLFPVGFKVVRAAENRTIATKLAQRGIEQWKNMPANLPTCILPIDDDGYILSDQLPGPSFEGVKENGDSYSRGNAFNYRQVQGETVKIPSGSYFSTGSGDVYGSQYSLFFSPIDIIREDGDLINFYVSSTEMTAKVADHNAAAPTLNKDQYAIDYMSSADSNIFYVAFPISKHNYSYSFTYSYWTDDGNLETKSNYSVIANNYDGHWIMISMPSDAVGIEVGTQKCSRAFKEIDGDWSDDPYEFVIADDLLGVIAFNPLAQGMTAHIDYEIKDPRIIHEDFTPDGTGETLPIQLSLKFILDAGEVDDMEDGDSTDNPDEPTFEGLVRADYTKKVSADNMIIPESIMVIDLETGYRVVVDEDWIDFKAGIIYLPNDITLTSWDTNDTMDVETKGRSLRFFYRADGDWTVQMQKAPSMFYRDFGNVNGSDYLDYRHYAVYEDDLQMIFSACNYGYTVSVDYSYFDANNVEHKVVGESSQIDKDSDNSDDYHIDLRCNNDNNVTLGTIYAVVGTSLKSRVIWRDGEHWRNVDIDTTLLRDDESNE